MDTNNRQRIARDARAKQRAIAKECHLYIDNPNKVYLFGMTLTQLTHFDNLYRVRRYPSYFRPYNEYSPLEWVVHEGGYVLRIVKL